LSGKSKTGRASDSATLNHAHALALRTGIKKKHEQEKE
jgi:hypothetical protein